MLHWMALILALKLQSILFLSFHPKVLFVFFHPIIYLLNVYFQITTLKVGFQRRHDKHYSQQSLGTHQDLPECES